MQKTQIDQQTKQETKNFGPVSNISPTYNFRFGIPGFENLQKFVFQDLEKYPPFQLFKSQEQEDLSMLVLNAKYIRKLKDLSIPGHELEQIGSKNQDEIEIFVILRVDQATKQFVANTKAPLIINLQNKLGNQIIIEGQDLESAYPLEISNENDNNE
ncbi:MAG TPA: flagellar assembly protein FliW [bacterium]|nr:flagellar assembly protein FliW [bacterium]